MAGETEKGTQVFVDEAVAGDVLTYEKVQAAMRKMRHVEYRAIDIGQAAHYVAIDPAMPDMPVIEEVGFRHEWLPAEAAAKIFIPPPPQEEEYEGNDEEYMAKEKMLTMRDVRAKHYEIFPGKDNKQRGQKEAILKYIEFLGVSHSIDISNWKISAFMKDGKVILDRSKINEIFFDLEKKAEKKGKKTKHEGTKYAKTAVLKDLNKRIGSAFDNQIRGVESYIKDYKDAAVGRQQQIDKNLAQIKKFEMYNLDYQRDITKYNRVVEDKEKELAKLKEKATATKDQDIFVKQIKDLLKTGNFILPKEQPARTDEITFITKPIRKTFFSEEQATNLMVPFGQFKITFKSNGGNWSVAVNPWKDNIRVKGRIHPHAGENHLCFGPMAMPWAEAVQKQNFYDAMMVVWDILANFEDAGDGYIPLYQFEAQYKKNLKLTPKQLKEQERKYREQDEDEDEEHEAEIELEDEEIPF